MRNDRKHKEYLKRRISASSAKPSISSNESPSVTDNDNTDELTVIDYTGNSTEDRYCDKC